jgi:hypothetical protein
MINDLNIKHPVGLMISHQIADVYNYSELQIVGSQICVGLMWLHIYWMISPQDVFLTTKKKLLKNQRFG